MVQADRWTPEAKTTPAKTVPAKTVPAVALLLGLAGLVPFVLGALALAADWPGTQEYIAAGLATYGAVILSFMGGVNWGLAMMREGEAEAGRQSQFIASVIPALIAWGALFLPDPMQLVALAAGFAALLLYDLASVRAGHAPAWYQRLRIVLTVGVLISLAISVLAITVLGV